MKSTSKMINGITCLSDETQKLMDQEMSEKEFNDFMQLKNSDVDLEDVISYLYPEEQDRKQEKVSNQKAASL